MIPFQAMAQQFRLEEDKTEKAKILLINADSVLLEISKRSQRPVAHDLELNQATLSAYKPMLVAAVELGVGQEPVISIEQPRIFIEEDHH